MSSNLQAAARAWLATLEEAGLTSAQAAEDLQAIAHSFLAEGQYEFAEQIINISREHRARGLTTAAEPEAAY
jgi:hypothetical protein